MTRRIALNTFRRLKSSLSRLDQLIYDNRKLRASENWIKSYPLLNRRASVRIPNYIKEYQDLEPSQKLENVLRSIEARIVNIRKSSKKLVFLDLKQDFQTIQAVYSYTTLNQSTGIEAQEFLDSYQDLNIGDSIAISGFPFRTKSGELSIRSTSKLQCLSPSLIPLGDLDPDNKYANYKVNNYLAKPELLQPLAVKHFVTNSIRRYLLENQFIEVETPIISNTANGANATPFVTSSPYVHDKNKPTPLSLRIAPELYLKKLIISGFDKVFEIGKVFRNEGIDSTHNPEFTTCEFYQSFINLNQLIAMTEEILIQIAKDLLQTCNHGISFPETRQSVDGVYSKHFKILDFIHTVEEKAGHKLPEALNDLQSLKSYFSQVNLPLPAVISVPNLLDKLASEYIEPLCVEPTIIINHPVEISPLSKSYSKVYEDRTFQVSKRFELFIGSREYVNAYEEENNPFRQTENFKNQLSFKLGTNDTEISMVPDQGFTDAMEYGMPPTGGWGCGIDRLAMLFSGLKNIDQVLSFGNLKDIVKY